VFNHGKLYYNSKVSIDFYPKYKEVVTPHEHFNRVPVDGQKLRPDGKKSFLENLAFEYEIKNFGVNKRNLPADVSDDGARTYIKMPKTNFDTLPALYDVGEDGKLKFTGYTIAGNYFIVDHIVRHGKLFFSPKAYVDIAFKEATK
jgi:type IV secretory pathway VirB9-like protein